jgi:DNA polymerase-3 subunit delta
LVAALVYGPDPGMVRERAAALAKSVVPDLSDPFRVAELDESALDSDPARLWDEAVALSMIGGRRVVRVRGAGNALAKEFERFLADPKGDALIVVEAGDLAKSASLRRVFEEADNAAAVACYPDR